MKNSRSWCFTSFDMELEWDLIFSENKKLIKYILVGKEICPSSKKFHYQGYIQLASPVSLKKIKKLISGSVHAEIARGSPVQNYNYCTKESIHFEGGTLQKQGGRSDLIAIKKRIDEEDSMVNIANDFFGQYMRYYKGFEKYKNLKVCASPKKYRNVKVTVLSGPTGSGKTRQVVDEHDELYILNIDKNEWWDGYQGEKVILIDDYNDDLPINRLLRILDIYKLRLPIKGGFTYAKWEKVFITTNLKELHKHARTEHKNALYRRIDEFVSLWPLEERRHEVIGNTELSLF